MEFIKNQIYLVKSLKNFMKGWKKRKVRVFICQGKNTRRDYNFKMIIRGAMRID